MKRLLALSPKRPQEAGIAKVFEKAVPPGQVAIAWCNSYSGVVLRTSEVTLLLDPVKVPVHPRLRADLLLVSHEHSDHWDPPTLVALQRQTGAPLMAPPFIARRMYRWLPHQVVRPLQVGEEVVVRGCRLAALSCLHQAREALSFLFRTPTGLAVYLPGDSSPFPGMEEVRQRFRPQVLVHMGSSLRDGAEVARLIQPKTVVTYDWGHPSVTQRARASLTQHVPEALCVALKRYQVFLYPGD